MRLYKSAKTIDPSSKVIHKKRGEKRERFSPV
jgi:hypothetical protein